MQARKPTVNTIATNAQVVGINDKLSSIKLLKNIDTQNYTAFATSFVFSYFITLWEIYIMDLLLDPMEAKKFSEKVNDFSAAYKKFQDLDSDLQTYLSLYIKDDNSWQNNMRKEHYGLMLTHDYKSIFDVVNKLLKQSESINIEQSAVAIHEQLVHLFHECGLKIQKDIAGYFYLQVIATGSMLLLIPITKHFGDKIVTSGVSILRKQSSFLPKTHKDLWDKYQKNKLTRNEAKNLLELLDGEILKQKNNIQFSAKISFSGALFALIFIAAAYIVWYQDLQNSQTLLFPALYFLYSSFANYRAMSNYDRAEKNRGADLSKQLEDYKKIIRKLLPESLTQDIKFVQGYFFETSSFIIKLQRKRSIRKISLSALQKIVTDTLQKYGIQINSTANHSITIRADKKIEKLAKTIQKEIDTAVEAYRKKSSQSQQLLEQFNQISKAMAVEFSIFEYDYAPTGVGVSIFLPVPEKFKQQVNVNELKKLFPNLIFTKNKEETSFITVQGSYPGNDASLKAFCRKLQNNHNKLSQPSLPSTSDHPSKSISKNSNKNKTPTLTKKEVLLQEIKTGKEKTSTEAEPIEWPNGDRYDPKGGGNVKPFRSAVNSCIPPYFFAKLSLNEEQTDKIVYSKLKSFAEQPHFLHASTGNQGIVGKKKKVRLPDGTEVEVDFKVKILGENGIGDWRAYGIFSQSGRNRLYDICYVTNKAHKRNPG